MAEIEYPVQQPGQCECGEFHSPENCPNTVRVDDDSWQFYDLMGEVAE
jgi:hypothetical protein